MKTKYERVYGLYLEGFWDEYEEIVKMALDDIYDLNLSDTFEIVDIKMKYDFICLYYEGAENQSQEINKKLNTIVDRLQNESIKISEAILKKNENNK